MSWQAYVDTSLIGSGHIDKAAIFSAAGDSKWASSANFHPKPEELKEMVHAFKDNSKVFANGMHVCGEKYVVIKAEGRSLYGRKGKEGIIAVKTEQSILIGHFPESVVPGSAAQTVENLADYLVSVKY